MALLAQRLAQFVLVGEAEDPKEFLRRMSAKVSDEKRRAGAKFVSPVEEWPEYEDLEDWQKVAVKQMEDAENSYFAFREEDHDKIVVNDGDDTWWTIYRDHDAAEAEAIGEVKGMLEDEPGNFTQTWLEDFIDMDRLRSFLHQDARDDDYWNESFPEYEDKLQELIDRDYISDDPRDDTNGEITDEIETLIDDKWEEMIESFAKQRLDDPIHDYLEDIYGHDEAVKKAMEWGGIDVHRAAESAVNTDGWQHFLARYDGHSHDLPGGAVYVRQ